MIEWNAIILKCENRLILRDVNFFYPRTKASWKSNKSLQGETKNRKRISRVIQNLGMLLEIICNCMVYRGHFYLPHVCTVFGFAPWLTRHTLRYSLILMKHCTFVVSAVLLLIGIEKKMWLMSCSWSRWLRTIQAAITHPLRASEPIHVVNWHLSCFVTPIRIMPLDI